MQAWPFLYQDVSHLFPTFLAFIWRRGVTYERMNLSRLCHLGFLGLNLMNRLKRTCATGAMPLQTIVLASRLSSFTLLRRHLHRGTGVTGVGIGSGIGLQKKQCKSIAHLGSLPAIK